MAKDPKLVFLILHRLHVETEQEIAERARVGLDASDENRPRKARANDERATNANHGLRHRTGTAVTGLPSNHEHGALNDA